MSERDDVRHEYEELKKEFGSVTMEEFRTGGWLPRLVRWMLDNYAKRVDAAYIRRKYPGAGARNQSRRLIKVASRYAGLAGGASAAAVTALELSLGGTSGLDAGLRSPLSPFRSWPTSPTPPVFNSGASMICPSYTAHPY
jgi:hypothetical protein